MFKKKILVLIITIINITYAYLLYAEKLTYEFSTAQAKGDWESVVIDSKQAIMTDQADSVAKIEINIPEEGLYQLCVSLYHQWQKDCPFIYFQVVDARGKRYSGYIFSERRWYLVPGQGRWEERCLSQNSFWKLSKGTAKIKFWPKANNSCWEQKEIEMNRYIYIDKFILYKVDKEKMIQMHKSS